MRRWSLLAITPDVDNLEELADEAVTIALQRSRTMTRLNRSTTLMGMGREHWEKAAKESELANLYLDRLDQRERRLQVKLDEGMGRMRQRAERLRGGKLWQIEQYLRATHLARSPSQA